MSVSAAPATPRWSPSSATAVAPPGRRTRSATRDGADGGVLALVLGDEQHLLLVTDVDLVR